MDERLVTLLNDAMTDDEQRMFCASFRTYLLCDAKKDFIVDFEVAFMWLGYTRKDHAKRMLTKRLQSDVDFITCCQEVSPRTGENPFVHDQDLLLRNAADESHPEISHITVGGSSISAEGSTTGVGGRPSERILMTVEGFKQLCMVAKTERGRRVREYYLKMETVMMEYMKQMLEESRQVAERAAQERNTLQLALEAERVHVEEMQRKLGSRYGAQHRGEHTYIFKDTDDPNSNIYNVGQTKDMRNREQSYNTHNFTGRFLYAKSCLNHRVLERVVHHILDQYRVIRAREWFACDYEVIKDVLDMAHVFLDSMIGHCDELHRADAFKKIREYVANTVAAVSATPSGSTVDGAEGEGSVDAREQHDIVEDVDADVQELPEFVRDPLDFAKFVEERCELGDDDKWSWNSDLRGCYRLWSRCNAADVQRKFIAYLKTNFKECKKQDPSTGACLHAYKGIAVKPMPTFESTSDVGRFVAAECATSYVRRISTKALMDHFVAWKRREEGEPSYELSAHDKRRIENELGRVFAPGYVFQGESNAIGFFGLSHKNDDATIGLKLNPKLKKRVQCVDIATKKVEHTFDSLNECAAFLEALPASVCTDIRYGRPRKGFLVSYVTPSSTTTTTID